MMKITGTILSGLLLLLSACTTVHPTALPGGGQGYAIGCGGVQHTMDGCLARAAEVCPAGYDIVTTTQEFGSAHQSLRTVNVYSLSIERPTVL